MQTPDLAVLAVLVVAVVATLWAPLVPVLVAFAVGSLVWLVYACRTDYNAFGTKHL